MILVTGASGFVGKHLVHALSQQGKRVRALYHHHAPQAAEAALPGIEWQQADLLDIYDVERVMADVDEIYHCAAVVSFDSRMHTRMMHFNPESTAHIVNRSLEQGIRRMVYLSSVAALGRPEEANKLITEEEQWGESKYNSAYGVSKHLAEMEVWRGIGEGLNAVIINPGIILGEGNWDKGSAALMKIAWKEFPFYTHGTTSWVDVLDVVNIMIMLMDSDYEAERYIVSSGNYSYKDIFSMMATALGRKPPRIHANSFLTGLVWRLNKLMSVFGRLPSITRETANNANARSLYSNSKLLDALPSLTYTPIEQTIGRMATTFLSSRN